MPPATDPATTPTSRGRIDALDGLRTVAVMLVVCFHFAAPGLGIGFIGVDVFFVLSGYLITTRLAGEVSRDGTINLVRFWARRLQRLLPAAMLVVFSVLVYAWFVARPYQRPDLGGDVTAATLYFANWHFIDQGLYFAVEARASALHHMWSLSLEEQFYLAWPLLVLATVAVGRALGWRRERLLWLTAALCTVLIMASFLVTQWFVRHPERPDRPYMGTDAKAFEPLIGALLALALSQPVLRRLLLRHARLLGWLGLVGAVGLLPLLRNRGHYYQGGALLFSVAIAALIVALVWAPDFRPGKLLGWAPLAYLGRISYGIYLWHWPLALAFDTHMSFHPVRAALALAATIACASASYHLVESPILAGRMPGWRSPRTILTSAAVLMLCALLTAAPLGGSFTSPAAQAIIPRPATSANRVMMVGDSVPYHLMATLDRVGRSQGLTLIDGTTRGCTPLGINQRQSATDVVGPRCAQAADKQADRISQSRPGVVIWWSRYETAPTLRQDGSLLDVDDPAFWPAQVAALRQSVDRLSAHDATVVIVLTERPSTGIRTRCTEKSCAPLVDRMTHRDELRVHWNDLVRQEARRDSRIRTISVEDVLCPAGNPPTPGKDASLCNDRLPSGEPGRPDGTHVNLNGFDQQVASAVLGRALSAVR